MSPEVRGELQGILSLLCEGAASEAQLERLHEMLESDPACRFLYLEYMDVHAQLLEHALPAAGKISPPAIKVKSTRQIFRYAGVALATLAASVLLQVVWWHFQDEPGPADQAAQGVKVDPLAFVATLTQGADCVWAGANGTAQVGPRLSPGILRLKKGIAQVRYDNGADLVLEGPVDLRLDSSTAATVLLGKVVFRADETAVPFDLHTPSSTLVDLGAEYAVSVGPDGEEIHVFDGEVQRTPKAGAEWAPPERLTAGEARGYGPAPATPGRPAAYDPGRFVRNLANLDPAPTPGESPGLLLYEGFDYATGDAFLAGKANGGFGWVGPWLSGFARPQVKGDTNVLALNPKESLVRSGGSAASVGGSFDYTGFARYHRRMATAVRMNADGVYFLSFLFRRHGPQADSINAVAVLLRTTDEVLDGKQDARKRLNVGVGGPNQLFTHLGKVGSRTALPLRNGETYLLVAKIVASRTGADQVFMRVYGPDQAVEREESGGWTVAGPPFHSDLVFDWMEIHINSKTRQTLDEVRIATTWSAATSPWSGRAAVGTGKGE